MFNIARDPNARSCVLLAIPLSALSCAGADPASDPAEDQALAAAPIPIHHVIVIVKENHTFDNYFGAFPGAEGTLSTDGRNLCPSAGGTVPCARAPDKTS